MRSIGYAEIKSIANQVTGFEFVAVPPHLEDLTDWFSMAISGIFGTRDSSPK